MTPAAGWDWPNAIPTHVLQRWTDMQAIAALEHAPQPMRKAWQENALREMLANTAQASGWWRRWLGASPSALSRASLALLPILSREDFRAAVESEGPLRMPPWHGATSPKSTSGSSGMPVQLHLSQLSGRIVDSHYMQDHRRHGRDLRRRLAALQMRFEPHPGLDHRELPGDPWQGIGPTFARQSQGATLKEHAAWLTRVNPAYLNIWPTVLNGLLDEYEAGAVPPTGLQQVLTVGETVIPALRERTRRVLGATLTDRYTCEEVGPIALQCPVDETHYHVCASNAIVEVVDDHGHALEGRPGRVLVTGLQHWACPAIRYDIGDIASLKARCSCGAPVPALVDLLGRRRFLIRQPSGERVFLNLSARDFLKVAPVREFRITQTTLRDIVVELVMQAPLDESQRAGLLAMLQASVSREFNYELRQVDAIAWTGSGKRQDTVSLV